MRDLEEKYRAELVVIGVHSAKFRAEQATEAVREAVLRYDIRHPVVNDRDLKVWQSYAVRSWPTMMFIDPRGKVIARHEGEVPVESFERSLDEMIGEFDQKGWLDRRPVNWRLEAGQSRSPLAFPAGVLADETSDRLFIADTNHHRLIISDLAGQVKSLIGGKEAGLCDGDFNTARFNGPQGLTLHDQTLYVADTGNHALRAVELTSQSVTTLAGNGQQARIYYRRGGAGPAIKLNSPWDVAYADGKLYITMAGFHQLWQYDLSNQQIGPWVGAGPEGLIDGRLNQAMLAQPSGLSYRDGQLYLACSEASALRKVEVATGEVTTLLGQGLYEFGDVNGDRQTGRLQHPLGVGAGPDGLIYLADTYNHRIKRYDPSTGIVQGWSGDGRSGYQDGPAELSRFNEPASLSFAGNRVYIADTNNHLIRVIDRSNGAVSSLHLEGWPN